MIEYQPWYVPGQQLARCLACGSLVSSADTETHTNWHEEVVTHVAGMSRQAG